MSGKNSSQGKRREEMGFSLHRFFLMIVGRTKRFKGNKKNGRMLNPQRLNGQLNA